MFAKANAIECAARGTVVGQEPVHPRVAQAEDGCRLRHREPQPQISAAGPELLQPNCPSAVAVKDLAGGQSLRVDY